MRKSITESLVNHLPLIRKKQPDYKLSQNAGASPGTLVYTGKNTEETPEITLYQYDEHDLEKISSENLDDILYRLDINKNNWINVSAIHDTDLVQRVGNHFCLHLLVMEDIVNTILSPQYDAYDDYLFITLKMLSVNPKSHHIEQEHVSFVLGNYFLISFQERKKDVLDPVRQRLEAQKGRIRKRGIDYLLYALLDVVIDNYYTITEEYGEHLAVLEDELIDNPGQNVVGRITHYKRQLTELRKTIYPLQEALRRLMNEETLVEENTTRFFSDVYSHVEHVINTMETQRDTLMSFMDLYMSTLSFRMNNVMKTLTIIATIFIPLTFVAGVYGMNFDYMPELHWKWAYPAVMGLMLVSGIGMYIYMKSRKWF